MYLHGEFLNRKGEVVRVEILTHGDRSEEIEIEGKDAQVWFTDEAVSIDSEMNDTFDALLTHSATIRLESAIALTGLYCPSCMDAVVNIRVDGRCVFAGFVEPQSYSQPFNDSTDDIEINCIDVLSALQYSLYGDVGSTAGKYDYLKQNAGSKTFMELLKDALDGITKNINISGEEKYSVVYDNSKKMEEEATFDIFNSMLIGESLFLGDGEDDVWSLQEVVEEMMKYLSLHIEQEGFEFYIFSWATAKGNALPEWNPLIGTGAAQCWCGKTTRTINKALAADTNATISMGESYNVISLTCQTEDVDVMFESPLSEDNIVSPYPRRQKYVTTAGTTDLEVISVAQWILWWQNTGGLGDGIKDYLNVRDWYIRIKNNPNWTFYYRMPRTDIYKDLCKDGTLRQELIPNAIGGSEWGQTYGSLGAALISWGYVDRTKDSDDNSLVSSVDMTDYLVIGVKGNKNEILPFPNETSLQDFSPVAEYNGPASGITLTPVDSGTTNYIVISGSLLLAPVTDESFSWKDRNNDNLVSHSVAGKNGGRYYNRHWWKTDVPCGPVISDETRTEGLCPPDEEGPQLYEFKYSGVHDHSDKISKVGVLACMLIVGDKCLVENLDGDGQISDFEWRRYKAREECKDVDEYYSQTFTIGFDPKIGDKLIGTDFDIQNNISFDLGIDVRGMAIPIKKEDNLYGKITFRILGPVNLMWDDITRRHATWFRMAKYGTTSVPLMAYVQNIYIKDFEVKLYSDNGMMDVDDNCDLIYMSDTDERYVNKKDDINFRFNSALTSEERAALGIGAMINISTPVDVNTNNGVLTIYDSIREETGKPEQIYVDEAWKECHEPRVEWEQNIDERAAEVNRFDIFKHPALGDKRFYIKGISRDLMAGEALLNLREIGDD